MIERTEQVNLDVEDRQKLEEFRQGAGELEKKFAYLREYFPLANFGFFDFIIDNIFATKGMARWSITYLDQKQGNSITLAIIYKKEIKKYEIAGESFDNFSEVKKAFQLALKEKIENEPPKTF